MTNEDIRVLFHHAAEIQRYFGVGRNMYILPPENSGWGGDLLNLSYLASLQWAYHVHGWPLFLDGNSPLINETWNRVSIPILPLFGLTDTSELERWKIRARLSDDEIASILQSWYDFIVPQTCLLLPAEICTIYREGYWRPETGEVFGDSMLTPIGTAYSMSEAFPLLQVYHADHSKFESYRRSLEIIGDVEKQTFRLETADIEINLRFFYGPVKGTVKVIHDTGEIVWTSSKTWSTFGMDPIDGYSWTISFDSTPSTGRGGCAVFYPNFN